MEDHGTSAATDKEEVEDLSKGTRRSMSPGAREGAAAGRGGLALGRGRGRGGRGGAAAAGRGSTSIQAEAFSSFSPVRSTTNGSEMNGNEENFVPDEAFPSTNSSSTTSTIASSTIRSGLSSTAAVAGGPLFEGLSMGVGGGGGGGGGGYGGGDNESMSSCSFSLRGLDLKADGDLITPSPVVMASPMELTSATNSTIDSDEEAEDQRGVEGGGRKDDEEGEEEGEETQSSALPLQSLSGRENASGENASEMNSMMVAVRSVATTISSYDSMGSLSTIDSSASTDQTLSARAGGRASAFVPRPSHLKPPLSSTPTPNGSSSSSVGGGGGGGGVSTTLKEEEDEEEQQQTLPEPPPPSSSSQAEEGSMLTPPVPPIAMTNASSNSKVPANSNVSSSSASTTTSPAANKANTSSSSNDAPPSTSSSSILSYDELMKRKDESNLDGLDPSALEDYISNAEFEDLFKMSRDEFKALPKWKQKAKKQEVKLF